MEVKGQAAIVTGGASGLGAACARTLAAAGARVAVFDVNDKAAAEVAIDINGIAIHCDVSDSASAEDAIKKLENYDFPGNVRELENILERALAMAENNLIRLQDLGLGKTAPTTPARATEAASDALRETLDLAGQEKNAILKALDKTRWNKTAAARLLGLSLRQLRYRLEKFGIE